MPAKNALKVDVPEAYYHVYARGVAKMPIFVDDEDFSYFRSLFARYLSKDEHISKAGVSYPHLRDLVKLLAYCQMSNHFHLLIYQTEQGGMATLMRSIMTAYSRYFNLRHKRTGPLFESRYKASLIDSDKYLQHISRYIHLNPRYYQRYKHSSYAAYTNDKATPEWLQPGPILALLGDSDATLHYEAFCKDYVDRRDILATVKHELADH